MNIYRWYINKLLTGTEGNLFRVENDKLIRKKGIVVILKKAKDGTENIYMTYSMFRSILEKNNSVVKEYITRGYTYSVGELGYLLPKRIERNFTRPKVNIPATVKYRKNNPESKSVIYFTDEDYIRIAWDKNSRVTNEKSYEFKPCKHFMAQFSNANITDQLLKFKYSFFPVKRNGN